MFRCVSLYFYMLVTTTRHRAKLRREVTYENYKTLIKSLLFQKLLPNLDIIYVYILFNSVYVYIYTNHGKLDNILGFR